ncbi:MAG: non-canonical purine NTP pyrophosphatase, RdgB/HAM1 family [Chloroflexi bacterium]|nr:non-canonical purine NTP pyrophosphatase, RdgB/HAM1 family [Chloroflexota bacterium]|tara:strand:+ start:12415 stop:13008 length:594 start_codon:yes stop_codon:yes gene_type:complete
MKVLVATTNLGKIKEFEGIFPKNIEILTLRDFNIDIDVEETGKTFHQNAFLKANEYYKLSNIPTISEDSGLEVSELKGEPGIYSARYGGENLNDQDRVDLILKKLLPVPNNKRQARFISVICGVGFTSKPIYSEGLLEGFISEHKEGKNGFGYDPIFIPLGSNKTTASMSKDEKNNISHRRKSIDNFLKILITDKII